MNLRICGLFSAQVSYDFESPPEPPDDDDEETMEDLEDSWEYFL